MTIHLIGHC